MNKKRIIFLIALISILCWLTYCFNRLEKRYNDYRISEEEYEEIISSRKERRIHTNIEFNQETLILDEWFKTYYYSVVEDNVSYQNPIVNAGKYSIAFEDVEINSQTINWNYYIKTIIYDDEYYDEYYLVCSSLPFISVSCDEIPEEKGVDVKSKLSLFDNRKEISNRYMTYDCDIHVRGNTSADYDKKNFKISLKEKDKNLGVSLLGLREDDDYILYGAYNDQERIRNVFSSWLWKEGCGKNNSFGLDNGNQYKYVELFFNNKYWGLYALGYPIDNKTMDLKNKETIYAKTTWFDEFRYDYSDDKTWMPLFGFEIKDGYDAFDPMNRFLNKIVNNVETISKEDINNAIDIYLFTNAILAEDTIKDNNRYLKNMYFTAKQKDDGYVVLYTPWDMDLTWGNIWNNKFNNVTEGYHYEYDDEFCYMVINPIYNLIQNGDQETIDKVKERYKYLRNNEWSDENLITQLEKYEADIFMSGAYDRDKNRWPDSNLIEENNLSRFKEFVINRFHYLDMQCYN